jgi:hypothetical protein
MSDWYDSHIPIRDDRWRDKLSYRLYMLADWVAGDNCHEVVIRDGRGTQICHVVARVPTISMPPSPYSVWCCDGRIDDGCGGCR